MKISEVQKILKSSRLSLKSKEKAKDIVKKMKEKGVTDLLRGQLVRILEDEAELNKQEKQYFEDVKITLDSFLNDAENRLRMANEEIEEQSK